MFNWIELEKDADGNPIIDEANVSMVLPTNSEGIKIICFRDGTAAKVKIEDGDN